MKKLYLKNKEMINYLFFGALTTFVNLFLYYMCMFTFFDSNNMFELQIANIVSWFGAVIFAYFTNRKYVFESENSNKKIEFFKFCSSRIFTLIVDMICMQFLVDYIKISDKISKIVVQIMVIIFNYVLSKVIVFKKGK